MKACKNVVWGCVVAATSILALLTKTLQFIRNILLGMIDIPITAAFFGTVIFGIFTSVYCFASMEGFLDALGFSVLVCLILALCNKLFYFVYMLVVKGILEGILNFCDFEVITNLLTSWVEKVVSCYLKKEAADNNSADIGREIFFMPWLLHGVIRVIEKVRPIICILIYPAFGIAGAYFVYYMILAEANNYRGSDLVISVLFAVVCTAFSVWIGHCVVRAMKNADGGAMYLNDLFTLYALIFREKKTYCNEDRESANYGNNGGCEYDWVEKEDNPFFELLSAATTESELRKQFHNVARTVHPDIRDSSSDGEKMKKLVAAYKACQSRFK